MLHLNSKLQLPRLHNRQSIGWRRGLILIGVIGLSLLSWLTVSASGDSTQPVPQSSRNLLVNPGFEGTYHIQCSFPGGKPWITLPCNGALPSMPWQTVQVADGWVGWWQLPSTDREDPDYYAKFPNSCSGGAPAGCVAWHNPEFRDTAASPQDPPRIRSGQNSQKYFTFWSVHEAGVYQVVTGTQPTMPLRFSVYMEVWSATKMYGSEPNPHFSFGQTNMHLKVGIDPTGGTDPWSKDIVWSDEHESYDQFTRFEVQAVARSTKVTVFTHSRPENPMEHNDVYVDDAELVVVGGGPSEPVIVNPPPVVVAVGAQPTSAPGTGGRITHMVKPGDTLFALALQYGVPVDQIMTLNGLTSESQIQIGHELLIAQAVLQPRAKPTQASPAAVSGEAGSGRGSICVQAFEDPEVAGSVQPVNDPAPISGTRFSVSEGQNNLIADLTLDGQSSDFCFTDLLAITYRVIADPPPGYLAANQRRWAVALTSDATVDIRFGIRPDPSVKPSNLWPIAALGAGGLCLAGVGGVWLWKRRRNRYYQ